MDFSTICEGFCIWSRAVYCLVSMSSHENARAPEFKNKNVKLLEIRDIFLIQVFWQKWTGFLVLFEVLVLQYMGTFSLQDCRQL